MKLAALVAVVVASVPLAAAPQNASRAARPSQPAQAVPDKVAEAYAQFLVGHRLEDDENFDGAIAAYKRAAVLDPTAADITSQLAGLYLRQNKVQEAMSTAEQALKIAPANVEGNRVLGIIYSALSDAGRENAPRGRAGDSPDENAAKAIGHLEAAVAHPEGQADPNVRATLARLYVKSAAYAKAIPLLTDLVNQEPGWGDGPMLLAEAYAGAGRAADAIRWLEGQEDPRLLPTLADFYERERRWKDAADTYVRALQGAPRNAAELKTRYATALMNTGNRADLGKARDVLTEVVSGRSADAVAGRAAYLMSQVQRRLGDYKAAEESARRVIAQNNRSPWGYYALAEVLEERHQYQAVVDELAPFVNRSKGSDAADDAGLLLPHLGFAYQELGQHDKSIAAFEEARRLSPKDPSVAGYLIEAHIAAKKYSSAVDVAREALVDHPDDLRLTRLQAQALRHAGKGDQGIAALEEAVKKHADEPLAYIALAQMYSEVDRGAQAVKVLQDAQGKFPSDASLAFELGAVFDKQKKFAEAESTFKELIAREPENSAALNYLGYMLAERGERLDESVGLLKRALEIDPENGSYLDSLGWAYYKADKLDLARDNLHRAADQLKKNSVIQDHYADVLFKLGRYDDAIAAWTQALSGDGDSINRADIDKKIRAAKQKLPKK
jgi:tetratricopeptide (TPR) repeat protein